ncbi:glycosyltransferase [Candidatus Latescibacterota bacterium]
MRKKTLSKKKIVYVHTGVWPTPSPSIVFVTGTAYGLSNHEPTMLVVRNGSSGASSDLFRSITGEEMPEQLEIIRAGSGEKTPGHSAFFRKTVRLIKSMKKKDEVRAVITRNIGFLPYLAYIRKRYKVPCFFETHDFYGDLSLRTDLKKTTSILKKHLFEKMFLPRLDGIICLTETQEEFFNQLYPKVKTTVARTGLIMSPKKDIRREKQVCYIGSLDSHKGLATVLSALSITENKDLKLLIIGGKDEHEIREFMKLANLVGVADRIKVTKWVHHSDIGHFIDTCIAGLVPLSNTPFNRYFTSPLKILDYFAHSLPVIASDMPSVREYIENYKHGILFEPDNPESLANALDHYVARNDFDSMSAEISKHAEQFLWTERGKRISEFINSF